MEPTERMREAARVFKRDPDTFGTDPIALVERHLGSDKTHYVAERKAKFSGPGLGKQRLAEMEAAQQDYYDAFRRAYEEAEG